MIASTPTRRFIDDHLVSGDPTPGQEIALQIDQTLTQDATGTLVMQELEAVGLERARTDVSVQYVDHNLLQAGEHNAEDHEFLRTAARTRPTRGGPARPARTPSSPGTTTGRAPPTTATGSR